MISSPIQRHQKAICSGGVYFSCFFKQSCFITVDFPWDHRHLFQGIIQRCHGYLKNKQNLCNKHQIDIRPPTLVFWVHPKLNQQVVQFLIGLYKLFDSQPSSILSDGEQTGVMIQLIFFPAGRTADEDSLKQFWIRFHELS